MSFLAGNCIVELKGISIPQGHIAFSTRIMLVSILYTDVISLFIKDLRGGVHSCEYPCCVATFSVGTWYTHSKPLHILIYYAHCMQLVYLHFHFLTNLGKMSSQVMSFESEFSAFYFDA
jgi:hypothetical protein